MGDRVGQQLGNYRLIKLLGDGGFAEVYLGEHLHLERYAAIKVLHARLTTQDSQQFRTEARLIAQLNHPHIVRILDFGIEGKTPFLVMDYAPNGTLRQRYPKRSCVTLETVVSSVKQVTDALQYAHDQRLVHRDIKPENILIGARNELLLSDFGIALVTQSSRNPGTQDITGTFAYCAPEQLQGKPRLASDQYALGIMVYEWLSGDRPFHGSFTELVGQHLTVPPPPLRQKIPSLSVEVEQVVMKALAKDYQQRFDSIEAFARALEQASQAPQQPLSSQSPMVAVPPFREAAPNLSTPMVHMSPLAPTILPSSPTKILPSTIPPISPIQTVPPRRVSVRRPSRRTVITGLIVVGVGTVGSMTWWAVSSLLPPPPPYIYSGHSGSVLSVTWSPDGKRIASASDDNTVQVWDATNGSNPFTYHEHSTSVNAVAWSPAGKRITSASSDTTVQVWDATDGGNVFTYHGHSNSVNAVTWSPDSKRIASASGDTTVQVWDATDGWSAITYHGHSSSVLSVAWSPDGKRIASASGDTTVQVWDATDGSNPFTYHGHSTSVNAVAWSPNGKLIASASYDNTVQVWDAIDGSHVYTYRGHSSTVNAVAWSSDGKRIASASYDKTVQVWSVG